MPYTVALPDGRTVEFPDSVSREEAAAIIRRQLGAGAQPKESTIGSEFVRGAKQLFSTSRTGIGALASPEEAARAGVERSQQIAAEAGEGPSLAAVRKAYEERGLLPAVGEVVSQIPRAVAGQVPQLAAMAGGAKLGAMAGAGVGSVVPVVGTGLGAIAGGVLGAGATLLPQFFGANVERQAAEQMQRGEPVSIDRGTAAAAAAGQAGIEAAGTALVLGKRVVKGILGVTDDAALATAKAREELVKAAARSRSGAALRGAGVGLAEIPVEVAQAVIERAQAGLDVLSPEALSEYGENAYLAGLVGPTIGAAARVTEPGAAKRKLAVEEQAKEAEARAAAAKAEEEKKKDPAYALQLDADYQAAVARMKELQAAVPKKPGKDALPEERAAYKDAVDARTAHLKDVLQPLTEEYRPRKAEIAQLRNAQQQAAELAAVQEVPQAAQTLPYYESAQATLPGMEAAEPPAAPPVDTTDYATQANRLRVYLDDLRERAKTTTDLEKKLGLGAEYERVRAALKEADRLAKKAAEEAEKPEEKQIAALRKKMVAAEEAGDIDAQVRVAQQLKALGVKDMREAEPQPELTGMQTDFFAPKLVKERQEAYEQEQAEALAATRPDLAPEVAEIDPLEQWKESLKQSEQQTAEELLTVDFERALAPTEPPAVKVPENIRPIQNPGTLVKRLDSLVAARDRAAQEAEDAFAAGNKELGIKKSQEREAAQTALNEIENTEGAPRALVALRKAQAAALMNAAQLTDDLRSGRLLGGRDAGTASSTNQTLINQIEQQRVAYTNAVLQEAATTRRLYSKSVTQDEAIKAALDIKDVFNEWVTRSMAQPRAAVLEEQVVQPAQMRGTKVVRGAETAMVDPRPLEERRFGAYRAATQVLQEQLEAVAAKLRTVPRAPQRVEPALKMQFPETEAAKVAEASGETAQTLEGSLRRRRDYVEGLIEQAFQTRRVPGIAEVLLTRARDFMPQATGNFLDAAENIASRILRGQNIERSDLVTMRDELRAASARPGQAEVVGEREGQRELFPAETRREELGVIRETRRNFENAPIVRKSRALLAKGKQLVEDINSAWEAMTQRAEALRAVKVGEAEEDVARKREAYREAFNAALDRYRLEEAVAPIQKQINDTINTLAAIGKQRAKSVKAKDKEAVADLDVIRKAEQEALVELRQQLDAARTRPGAFVEPAEMPRGATRVTREATLPYELKAVADEWVVFERERLAKAEAKLEKLKGPERQEQSKVVTEQRAAVVDAEQAQRQAALRMAELNLPGMRVEKQTQSAAIAALEERIPKIKSASKKAKALMRLARLKTESGTTGIGVPGTETIAALRSTLVKVAADKKLTPEAKEERLRSLNAQLSALESKRGEALKKTALPAEERAEQAREDAEASRKTKEEEQTALEQRILDLGSERADKEAQLGRARTDEGRARYQAELDEIDAEVRLAEAQLGTEALGRIAKRREYKRRASLFSGRGVSSEKELLGAIAQKLEDKKPLTAYEKKVWEKRNEPKTKLSEKGKRTYFEASEALRRERESGVGAAGVLERDEVIDVGGIRFSRGPTESPSTIASVRTELSKAFPDLGRVQIYDSVEALVAANPQYEGRIPDDARGFVDTAGNKAFLIAENINQGQALSVLLHEVGAHIGLKNMLGEAQYNALVKAVQAWEKRNDASQESRVARAARARVEAAETPASQVNDELLAYAVEEAVNAGVKPMETKGVLGQWLSQIATLFRKALEKFGMSPETLDAQGLVDLAFGAAKMEMRGMRPEGASKQATPASDFIINKRTAFIKGAKGEAARASLGLRQLTEDDDAYDSVGKATFITGMDVAERGKGLGKKLLSNMVAWADANNTRLALIPAAAPDSRLGGLTQQQLKDWYGRNGFKSVGDYMVREPATKPEILFSRNLPTASRVADSLIAQEKGIFTKLKENFLGMGARTQFVDKLAPTEEALKRGGTDPTKALQAMYYLRMYDQRMHFTSQSITDGVPERVEKTRRDGTKEYLIETKPGANIQQIVNILKAKDVVKAAGSPDDANKLFTLYLAAIRGDRVGYSTLNFGRVWAEAEVKRIESQLKSTTLSQEQRSVLQKRKKDLADKIPTMPTEADIKAARAEIEADPTLKKAFDEARDIYNQYNRNLLEFSVQTGALSRDEANKYLRNNDYIPYYRMRDGVAELMIGNETPIRIGNLKDSPHLKELVGGDEAIFDFLTSSVQNTSMLLDMATKNLATKNLMFELRDVGLATVAKVPKSGKTPEGAVTFKRDGEDYFAVVDTDTLGIDSDLLVKGLAGIPTMFPAFIRVLGIPARILRRVVVASPVYMARQLFRDSLAATLSSGANTVPVLSSLQQIGKPKALQGRGITGGQVFTGMPEDQTRMLKDMQAGKISVTNGLAWLEAKSAQVDALTREAQYESYRKQGLSEMEATLMALESMNFSKRGLSPTMHMASTLIPFFNAQIQGLDVLYKAFTGQMPLNERLAIREKLWTRGLMLAGLSMAYAVAMQDDETYKNAKPEEKYGNWFVPVPGFEQMVRLPIPFELGYIFKALPEAMVNIVMNEKGGEEAAKALTHIVKQTIPGGSSYLIPQALKPALEALAFEKSLYTGRSIESAKEQMMQPGFRYRENTTALAREVGELTGFSPIKMEFLISGYFGTMGMALLAALSAPFGKEGPESATKRASDMPVVGTLFQPNDASGIIDATYERMKQINQVKETYEGLIEKGRIADANNYLTENASEMALASVAGSFKQVMGEVTKYEREVRASNMSPEEKRKRLDEARQIKIRIASSVRAMAGKKEPQAALP